MLALVAEALLWRDIKLTLTVLALGGLPVLFFCFALYDKKGETDRQNRPNSNCICIQLKSRARAKINLRKKQ
ncbi:hypothetical protein SASPL_156185 [Salvia splendens]|uniref:Uncharacterized protein n=1 Tax=Salvia splendens TaxID=180675 RepID=A0A8X8VXA1_SALSN|nr:hypothetical protein SASPL_156185 [Salvia splendens]